MQYSKLFNKPHTLYEVFLYICNQVNNFKTNKHE